MSSAISKFTASLMAGSQETTVALASLNFDFSLYKVEAPREYQVLGQHLSDERRRQAEEGSQHVTARKLGAIFRSKLPKVPYLLKAFGSRVSEIAAASSTRGDGKSGPHASSLGGEARNVFSKNAGIDGTSLWAAATSGTEALCVQLLACVLARFWTASQATSIWSEIVDARKAELKAQEDGFDFAEIAALNAAISRDQLAEWDASARSWLQTADVINSKKLTQLRLIIENINVTVNNTPSTYESVMEAWIESMKVVDQLIAGVAQSVHNGAALLGLSAWHLYPNMAVYTNGAVDIVQDDSLFKLGGTLTVGLLPSDEHNNGVRWSLPLAKLRYYGEPIIIHQTLNHGSSKVSFMELMLAVLGSLAAYWPEMPDKYDKVCQYYALLGRKLRKSNVEDLQGHCSAIATLSKAAENFLAATSDERTSLRRLMEFGHRNGATFLCTKKGFSPDFDSQMLGLTNSETLMKYLKNTNLRLTYLRELVRASSKKLHSSDWIIIFKAKERRSFGTVILAKEHDMGAYCSWWSENGQLLSSVGTQNKPEPWIEEMVNDDNRQNEYHPVRQSLRSRFPAFVFRYNDSAVFNQDGGNTWTSFSQCYSKDRTSDHINPASMRFEHCFGDPVCAALYKKAPKFGLKPRNPPLEESVSFDEVLDHMQKDLLDFDALFSGHSGNGIEALTLLGDLADIYQDLERSGARVSLDVVRSPLSSKRCLSRNLVTSAPKSSIAFSTIAYFETGDQDIDPTTLGTVMAMVVGDSIYASSILTSDPHQDFQPGRLERTFGNIGKPGISLIIPPPNPKIRRTGTWEWNVINHYVWDGRTADHFAKTSLHLCLTDYRVPYATQHQGQRDIQASFQEAVVSIYDGETWVADVDIVKALTSNTTLIKVPRLCKHGTGEQVEEFPPVGTRRKKAHKKKLERDASAKEIVCADSWHEVLDKSNKPMIVRSHGNWVGRLAAASLSAQLGCRTLLLPDEGCEHGCFSNPKFISGHLVTAGDVIIS